MPKKSTFACAADGSPNDMLTAIKATNKTGPMAAYVIQGYSPAREKANHPYSGRFFAAASDVRRYNEALREWAERKDTDLQGFWPTSELPFGFMTHMNNGGIPNHGYTHWWKMFNPLQLLILCELLKVIIERQSVTCDTKEALLGAFQQYLRNQNMFVFWQIHRDCMAPHFSNNNYHPKANVVENSVFSVLGSGNWNSCYSNAIKGLEWAKRPWEVVVAPKPDEIGSGVSGSQVAIKNERVQLSDSVIPTHQIFCSSASDLSKLTDKSIDLVHHRPSLWRTATLLGAFGFLLRLAAPCAPQDLPGFVRA